MDLAVSRAKRCRERIWPWVEMQKKKKKENVLINYFKKDRLVVTQREHMVSLPLSAPGS